MNGSHGRTSDEQLLVPGFREARLSHISVSCIGYYGCGMASSISSVPHVSLTAEPVPRACLVPRRMSTFFSVPLVIA